MKFIVNTDKVNGIEDFKNRIRNSGVSMSFVENNNFILEIDHLSAEDIGYLTIMILEFDACLVGISDEDYC